MAERFTCRENSDGTWSVWDHLRNEPASLGGRTLTGSEERRARAACDVLTRIYRNRLEHAPTHQVDCPEIDGNLDMHARPSTSSTSLGNPFPPRTRSVSRRRA